MEVISRHVGPQNRILHPKIPPGTRSEVCTREIYMRNVKHMLWSGSFQIGSGGYTYAQTLIVVAFLVVNFFIEMVITRDHGVGQVPG